MWLRGDQVFSRAAALRGNTSDEIALFYYSLSLAREEEEHRLIRFSAVVR